VSKRRRNEILPRLGLRPSISEAVGGSLAAAFSRAEAAARQRDEAVGAGPLVDALDAGCGRRSALVPFRSRTRRLVGVDLHVPPPGSMPHLDEFAVPDLCGPSEAFAGDTFDIVLSSFTVEHFADPPAAFRNLRRWIRPGGSLVISTVNRRHPLVWLYLSVPQRIQRPMQRWIKLSAADAHPLVGACNDPACLRHELEAAGFADIRLLTLPNLARTWSRRWPGFLLGVAGDLLAQPFPSRRSTIVAEARVPD
jgi:SAM-dependent methyltransferase